GRGKILAG
ncbi:hypothetical protein ECPA23_0879, partial [Escherichia coli PA23]